MKLADDFPTTIQERQSASAAELTELLTELNITLHPQAISIIAEAEQFDVFYDIDAQHRVAITCRWQPVINFWMEMMWSMKQQRHYIKLARVMQSIATREAADGITSDYAVADDFASWCSLALYYQSCYFAQE
jgi:hypothetical protein